MHKTSIKSIPLELFYTQLAISIKERLGIYKATARPAIETRTAAKEPMFFVAAPVNLGGVVDPPGPLVADGRMGEPVAAGLVAEPAPEPDGELPVGAATPVANPVDPAMPVELRSVSFPCASDGCISLFLT